MEPHLVVAVPKDRPTITISLGADNLDCPLSYAECGKLIKALIDVILGDPPDRLIT